MLSVSIGPVTWNGVTGDAVLDDWVVEVDTPQTAGTWPQQLAAAEAWLVAQSPAVGTVRHLSSTKMFDVTPAGGYTSAQLTAALQALPEYISVAPNYLPHTQQVPNDAEFGQQYALQNIGQTINNDPGVPGADIGATGAWDINTGSGDQVIAFVDSGVDIDHPDLVANLWVNPGEIPGNGIDDDENGYIDDVHGVNTFNHDPEDVDDDYGHGTHVSGIAAAVGNNGIGVSGVNWNAKIMAANFTHGGIGSVEAVIEAINYTTRMKSFGNVNIRVSNHSYGLLEDVPALATAITAHLNAGILFVAAAGNDATNNDVLPFYPAAYDDPRIITVGATTNDDEIWDDPDYGSNYGPTSVDLAAPGKSIYSTTNDGAYDFNRGTSMAAPMVTGAAALLFDTFPNATPEQVKQALLDGVDVLPTLEGKMVTGGRLNVYNSMEQLGLIAPVAVDDHVPPDGTSSVDIDILANDDSGPGLLDPASIDIVEGPSYGSYSINTQTGVLTYTPFGPTPGGDQLRYRVANQWGTYSNIASITIGDHLPPVIDPIADVVIDEGSALALPINVVDPEGGPIYVEIESGPSGASILDPFHPVLTWPTGDNTNGPVTIKLVAEDFGTPSFRDWEEFNITVNNVAPTVNFSGQSGQPGSPLSFTLAAIDPSWVDQGSDFTFEIDWDGDDVIDETIVAPSGTVIQRSFPTSRHVTGHVTAIDKDGGRSAPQSFDLLVSNFFVLADPVNPALTNLVYYGTMGGDEFSASGSFGDFDIVMTRENSQTVNFQATFAGITGRLIAHAKWGNDNIDASASYMPVTLIGGSGSDTLRGGHADDVIYGDQAETTVEPGSDDFLYGGDGNDTIVGDHYGSGAEGGNDVIDGGDGNDWIYGDHSGNGGYGGDGGEGTVNKDLAPGGNDIITGGAGNDHIYGDFGGSGSLGVGGNDTIDGQFGSDIIYGDSVSASLTGGNDVILGGGGDDAIHGNGGDDLIKGDYEDEENIPTWPYIPGGDDLIYGDDGNDTIVGGGGEDEIHGGAGNDLIEGDYSGVAPSTNNWDDVIHGDDGDDVITGGKGADQLYGDAGDDLLLGQAFEKTLSMLAAIQAEWLSARDYETRFNNIRGPFFATDPRLNGDTFILPRDYYSDEPNDLQIDTMTGGDGQDAFFGYGPFFNQDPWDVITDLEANVEIGLIIWAMV